MVYDVIPHKHPWTDMKDVTMVGEQGLLQVHCRAAAISISLFLREAFLICIISTIWQFNITLANQHFYRYLIHKRAIFRGYLKLPEGTGKDNLV